MKDTEENDQEKVQIGIALHVKIGDYVSIQTPSGKVYEGTVTLVNAFALSIEGKGRAYMINSELAEIIELFEVEK